MAQWLKAYAAFVEDQSSIPSTHVGSLMASCNSS